MDYSQALKGFLLKTISYILWRCYFVTFLLGSSVDLKVEFRNPGIFKHKWNKNNHFYLARSSLGGLLILIPRLKEPMLYFNLKQKLCNFTFKKLGICHLKHFENAMVHLQYDFQWKYWRIFKNFIKMGQNEQTNFFWDEQKSTFWKWNCIIFVLN